MENNTQLQSESERRIETAFVHDAEVDARHVRVEVEEGKVMLRGQVRSWRERDEALSAAWSVPGVTEVDDRLDVALLHSGRS